MRTVWSSGALPDNARRSLWYGRMVEGGYYSFSYFERGKSRYISGRMMLGTEGGRKKAYVNRHATDFQKGEWVHVAVVWGKKLAIYVDGKLGKQKPAAMDHPPIRPIKELVLGHTRAQHNSDAAFDELRISDVERYTEEFTPPGRDKEFEVDEHTRALFHFNGDVKGLSHGGNDAVPAKLVN
jgi:hypothetical protein